MAVLRLFAAAREAAGTGRDTVDGDTVEAVLAAARDRYGARFGEVLDASRVWLNGEPADPGMAVRPDDEVAVLPPVSGGATAQDVRRRPAPRPAPVPRKQPGWAPVLDDDRPHGRIGAVWLVVSVGLLLAGVVPLAAWLALHAAVASVQMGKSWRRRKRPVTLIGVGGGAVVAVAASVAGGPAGLAGVIAGALIAGGLTRMRPTRGRSGPPAAEAAWCAAVPGVAAASLVAARAAGVGSALALLLLVAAWDAANYIMGTGARWRWVGPAAGAAAVGVVALAAAAVGSPPMAGSTAWVLGGAVAITAPLGPRLATLACGDRTAQLSALRRLDSLLVAGPAWWILVRALPGR